MTWVRLPARNKIGILFNPEAGDNRKDACKIHRALCRIGETFTVTGPNDIEKALFSLAKSGKSWLLISGGDGTVQMALSTLFNKNPYLFMPYLCILPGGTTNLIAIDVGPKTSQPKAIKQLEYMIEKRNRVKVWLVKRHILKVSTHGERRYCMFIGGGLIAKGVCFYENSFRKSRAEGGKGIALTFFKSLIDFLFSSYATAIEVKIDAIEKISGKAGLFMATTLARLFGNMRPFWQAGPEDPKLTIIFKEAKGLWRLFPYIVSGHPHPELNLQNGYFSCSFSRIGLFTSSPLSIDGELLHPHSAKEPFLIEKANELIFWKW